MTCPTPPLTTAEWMFILLPLMAMDAILVGVIAAICAERKRIPMHPNDIEHRFTYHPPDAERAKAHADCREVCIALARVLNTMLPEGREKSLAITHLEEVMFWSNAAIARQPKEGSES